MAFDRTVLDGNTLWIPLIDFPILEVFPLNKSFHPSAFSDLVRALSAADSTVA
jgi:hypothetical protein